jgi:hypothetical protein
MAKIMLRGWLPDSKRPLIPLVKGLRNHLHCSLPEAVEMAADCTDLGKIVIREDVPVAVARRLSEELRSLGFDLGVEE